MRASLKARAVHGVGLAVADRAQQGGQLGRIVLEVGVLRDDHITRRGGDAALERGALATIGWLTDHALDRKSTRLNSSHSQISYADFCSHTKVEMRPHLHGARAEPPL